MRFFSDRILFFLLLLPVLSSVKCQQLNLTESAEGRKTSNVVIVVIDGPRYSETWGDASHTFIPRLATEMAKEGIVNTSFFNQGPTYTNAGHAAITTGIHQGINNGGRELPRNPSIFQLWLKASGKPQNKAWLVTSKDKLEILADTKDKDFSGKYLPATNCGVAGNGTGYRADSTTLRVALQTLKTHKPNLLLVNFKEPDASGHAGNWNGYLQGIKASDEYAYQLWKFLNEDPHYKNTTAFFLTNDHGRHLDGKRGGFKNHGDNCSGCRHLNFFASGPDFKKNVLLNTKRNQTDIAATVASLLNFEIPVTRGEVMKELFTKK